MTEEQLTRRKFLKKSATGAAVIGLFPDVLANFGMNTRDKMNLMCRKMEKIRINHREKTPPNMIATENTVSYIGEGLFGKGIEVSANYTKCNGKKLLGIYSYKVPPKKPPQLPPGKYQHILALHYIPTTGEIKLLRGGSNPDSVFSSIYRSFRKELKRIQV